MQVERTFFVDRSIDEVFAFLSDFENTEQWDPGTVSTTRTSGDGGLGTTYRSTSRFMGREVTLDYETIAYDPPSHVVLRGVNGRTTTADVLTFVSQSDGRTQITYRAEFDFGFPLSVLAPVLLRSKLTQLADETVEQIRRSLSG